MFDLVAVWPASSASRRLGVSPMSMQLPKHFFTLFADSICYSLSSDPDVTWNYQGIVYWTEIEITAMILCTCIPSLRPLLRLILSKTFKSILTKTPAGGSSLQEQKSSASQEQWQRRQTPKRSDEGWYSLESASPSRGKDISTTQSTVSEAEWPSFPNPAHTATFGHR
jgi:hypothetical protein